MSRHAPKKLLCLILAIQAFCAVAQDSTKTNQLQEVVVKSSVLQTLRKSPLNILVIDTKAYYQTNLNSLDILKRSSGVNIRTNGAYGANAEFFLNGIRGKQIKFFVDGNPVDNLGDTQGINIVPIQQTERFEVYKGVIPIELGTDALGGAINIVTRRETKDFVDFSTSYGSFNTTKNNLQFRKGLGEHFYVMGTASLNHADNDYRIEAEVPDEFGTVAIKRVRRFHDQFDFTNVKLETGLRHVKWADAVSVQVQYAQTRSDLQHNFIMRQPYGEASYTDRLRGITLTYQNFDLAGKLDINTYLSFNQTRNVFTDTTLNVYNWEGRVVDRRYSGGEISTGGNWLTTESGVFNARQVLTYRPGEKVKISLANTFQAFRRRGEDPFALEFYGADFFGQPQVMRKNVAGLSVESQWWDGKLVNLTSLKHFYGSYSGNKRDDLTFVPVSQTPDQWGANTAFTYFLSPNLFAKASYEKATRLPDETESFGDLRLVRPNPALLPERSDNVNLNLIFRNKLIDAELSGFFRNVENIIYLPPAAFYAQYLNALRVQIRGVESAVKIHPRPWLDLDANVTFQDLRNRSLLEGYGTNSQRYFGARMPNVPYLFANGGFTARRDSVLQKSAHIQLYWNAGFVHDYYLYWAIDGDPSLKNRIPSQFVNHLGASIFHYKSGVSLAFDVNNLFDRRIYDNFKVQLPGRAYSVKLRIYQTKP